MKTVFGLFLIGLICLIPSTIINAQAVMPEENWDRSLALSVVRQADTQALLKSLFQLARAGSNSDLTDALYSIEQDSATQDPVKDFLIYSFAIGLSDLDANAVSPEVLDFLAGYEARCLVSHHDHPRMVVPLFNVRAATAGVRNNWDRQQASIRAEGILQEQPDQWISTYLAASLIERRGFIDALDFASTKQLNHLGWSALALLDEKPELTLITVQAGMASGDFELLRQAISRGSGPGFSKALAVISSKLSDDEAADLLDSMMHSGSDARAALAIAHLAHGRQEDPVIGEMLFGALADRNLGAAAALLLGASQNPKIQARLDEIASQKDGLSQQRAKLAINIKQADRGKEK